MKRNWWISPDLKTTQPPAHLADEILREFCRSHNLGTTQEGKETLREMLVAVIEDFYEWADDMDDEIKALTKRLETAEKKAAEVEDIQEQCQEIQAAMAEANSKMAQMQTYMSTALLWREPPPPPTAWQKVATEE